ncbi:MAG: hypothetical protein KC438_11185 [Thermomicrobiales bacterium]|nr:hypothetical protein [Thermomicrobiales bacterium]MCO5222488.1 hypothetical protein [Thermomicrobiales bacterium]
MMAIPDTPWFTAFSIEPEDRSDADVVWADEIQPAGAVRKPTRAEKMPILLVGIVSIGSIVIMAVTLIAAVYLSRR